MQRTVLLRVRQSRLPMLKDMLQRVVPHALVLVVQSNAEAAARLALGDIDLLALDLQVANGHPLALVQMMARSAPATTLMIFAEPEMQPAVLPYGLQSWRGAEAALRRAMDHGGSLDAHRQPPRH